MEYKGCHPLLQFTEQDMLEARKEYGISDVKSLNQDIDSILEWFSKQPHLVDAGIERDVIERMMIQAKGSVERTKERIERLYTLKGSTPELCANRDTHDPSFENFGSWYQMVSISKLMDGKRITVSRFVDDDPKKFEYNMPFKVGFMVGDFRLSHDYSRGDIHIIDLKCTNYGHLAKVNPYIMKKAQSLYQDGYGARICGIHVLNAPMFADKLLFIMKQVLKPKLMDRIMLHSSLEELHQHVPKEYLPSDFGGNQKSMKELYDDWREEMRSEKTRQFLINSEKFVADESKRIGGKREDDELAGSFRKLQFD